MHRFIPKTDGDADALLDPKQLEAIKRWTRETLRLRDEAVITVTETACVDPGCPLLETIIAVFDEGMPTRAWRFTRPRAAVTKAMVMQTLATPPETR